MITVFLNPDMFIQPILVHNPPFPIAQERWITAYVNKVESKSYLQLPSSALQQRNEKRILLCQSQCIQLI